MEHPSHLLLITRDEERGVMTLTLNRPEKRNALNGALVSALRDALKEAAALPHIRVVVLTGAGEVFSAGADLKALQAMRDAGNMENLDDSRNLAELFKEIYLHPKPVIARINGHAIAGGCGLAAVCDFSIAVNQARLGFTEVRIGFVPAIVSVFVLRKLGETAARELFLTGKLIDAKEAALSGLITLSLPKDQLDQQVNDLVTMLATQTSPSAITLTKRLLAQVPGMGLGEALDHAVQMNAFARGTEDCQGGIQSFLEKKPFPWQ